MTYPIKDFYGRVLGYIEEDSSGNKTARDFYHRILGKYVKSQNVTKDFYGRVISKGDTVVGLIYSAK